MEPQQTNEQANMVMPQEAAPMAAAPAGDTHSYRGWLNSDHFYKRCLAVFGYALVGNLMIALVFILISVILGAAASA